MVDVESYGDMYAEDKSVDTPRGAVTRAWLKDVDARNKQFKHTINDRDAKIAKLEIELERAEREIASLKAQIAAKGWSIGAIDV